MWIQTEVEESLISSFSINEKVKVKFLTYPDLEIEGKIDSISPIVFVKKDKGIFSKEKKFVSVKISMIQTQIDKLSSEIILRPGMSVQVNYPKA